MLDQNIQALASLIGSDKVKSVSKLNGGGGDRLYYRFFLDDETSVIGVVADDCADAQAFVRLTEVFADYNIPVPRIYCFSPDYKYYIEEDLGEISLFDLIKHNSFNGEQIEKVIDILVSLHCIPESRWKDKTAYSPFSRRLVMWDLNYFKYEYLKPSGVSFNEEELENDFEKLVNTLVSVPDFLWGFQMRDCQSRNIMMHPNPYIIDYQGGRKGPVIYDTVSFLWQAKADFSTDFKNRMLNLYADKLSNVKKTDKNTILYYAPVFALFRTLQVLGAYGFKGLVQKRAHFIESIPFALKNLRELLSANVLKDYNELKKVCEAIANDNRYKSEETDELTVKVFSFSYKKGYPDDFSGNGGGFMFDCRGMHNPGRYDEYKNLTGRDQPVIDFLREKGEADEFAVKAYEMVKSTVERYRERKFTSLQIGFGCTGGRHRSVYCAERVAKMIAEEYPDIRLELLHREQNVIQTLTT